MGSMGALPTELRLSPISGGGECKAAISAGILPAAGQAASEDRPREARQWGWSAWGSFILILFVVLAAWGLQTAVWFQPTAVGILWAASYLSGFLLGGVGRGRLGAGIAAGALVCLSMWAIEQQTEIPPADSLLLAAILVTGGWAAAVLDPRMVAVTVGERRQELCGRWSIWDLAFVTWAAACLVYAAPQLQTPLLLRGSILVTVLSGLAACWAAGRWVWLDQWPLWRVVSLACLLGLCLGLVAVSGPSHLTLLQGLRWLVGGPLNVIAAQGLTVLVMMGLWRVDRERAAGACGAP
ncbi:MAG: hypothetical protein KDA45_07335 [Planctomycetales bacterium]|nr:hypothetical protein [Planctomycetales bacterium]